MAGPQFFHIQSFARSPNKGGQSVEQVLAEAAREPRYSRHVDDPKEHRVIFGLSPGGVRQRHDEMVAAGGVTVSLKDGKTARRGIRKDRHTLMTCVASHPNLTSQIMSDPAAKADYDAWVDRNLRFLRGLFGEQLVSMIEHVDEEHPHLHAYILPLNDTGCSARELNPCWVIKTEAEATARDTGHDDKTAVKFGNLAYRAKARELQDQYYDEVGLASGLTRTGPKRERLSRQQWSARKGDAMRTALTMQQIEEKAIELAEREDALNQSVEIKAQDIVAKLDAAEILYAQAEADKAFADQERARVARLVKAQATEAAALRAAAEEEAKKIKAIAEDFAAQTATRANTALTQAERKATQMTQELLNARRAFETEKAAITEHISKEAAVVAVRLIAGVLNGDVGMKPDGAGWYIRDDALRDRAQALKIGTALRDVVSTVAKLWDRLKGRLTAVEHVDERTRVSELVQRVDPPSPRPQGGFEP
ncbi:hypothetical protein E4191_10060 [Paracoccus liaowanqingii]|uniref:Mob protein n=1 Tax=Paracoccus liaowanqingii TaxID=2560053 RepID=A0A4P7HLH9_9RHOB|nr:plasmid recombination protein [Paracoccus liaowanqingii]QBX35015.1 hypothetical protein E4191_10060 [Paracoccus liaowanqingii]